MTFCKAELHIAVDHGDNRATMRCQLETEHSGSHQERFRIGPQVPPTSSHDVLVEWFGDDAGT